jgi:hypothetical protein
MSSPLRTLDDTAEARRITAMDSGQQDWHAVPSFPTISEVWLHLLEGYGR